MLMATMCCAVPDCVNFGEPGSGMVSLESGNVMAMSDVAGEIDA